MTAPVASIKSQSRGVYLPIESAAQNRAHSNCVLINEGLGPLSSQHQAIRGDISFATLDLKLGEGRQTAAKLGVSTSRLSTTDRCKSSIYNARGWRQANHSRICRPCASRPVSRQNQKENTQIAVRGPRKQVGTHAHMNLPARCCRTRC